MNFPEYAKQGFRMLLFDRQAVRSVVTDKFAKRNGFQMLFLLSALAGVLGGGFYYLMLYFVTRLEGGVPSAPALAHFVVAALLVFAVSVLVHLLSVGVTHLFARLFGGKRPLLAYFAVWMGLGFAMLVVSIPLFFLALIPFAGFLISLAYLVYSLALTVFVVRETYLVSTGKAVLIVLAPLIIVALVAFLVALYLTPAYTVTTYT